VAGSSKCGEREGTKRNIFTSREEEEEEEHRRVAAEQGPQQDPMATAVNVGGGSEGERRERMTGTAYVTKPELK
jgi:hypothetical protein